jgi:MFS family permease
MSSPTRKAQVLNVIQVSSGNFLEMYDFMVFGYFASAIGQTYFPTGDPFVSLMSSLMTFGVGFLMRPIGALILGAYIDRYGRRAGLILTLALMSVGTFGLAFTPGFAVIGIAAPLFIVFSRLLQGFSAGAELGGVSVYLAELATPGHKGFYVSWQSASQQAAVMFTALLGVILGAVLPVQALDQWGWRIPFFIGCLIIPVLFLLRRYLPETEAFRVCKHRPSAVEVWRTLIRNWGIVLIGVMLVTMTTVSFYLITAYTPTFGKHELRLAPAAYLTVTLCVGLSNFIWLPVMGALSDRIGRIPILVAATVVTLLTAYPAMLWLTAAPSFNRLLIVELWLSFLYASYNGAMVVALTEIMPEEVRTTGFSLAYSLATALFGGFTPAICESLIKVTGNQAMPGLWMSTAAAIGLVATLLIIRRDKRGDRESTDGAWGTVGRGSSNA